MNDDVKQELRRLVKSLEQDHHFVVVKRNFAHRVWGATLLKGEIGVDLGASFRDPGLSVFVFENKVVGQDRFGFNQYFGLWIEGLIENDGEFPIWNWQTIPDDICGYFEEARQSILRVVADGVAKTVFSGRRRVRETISLN